MYIPLILTYIHAGTIDTYAKVIAYESRCMRLHGISVQIINRCVMANVRKY